MEAKKMKGRMQSLAIIVVLTASACSSGADRQRVRPTHPDEKYGEHEKQAFDLYLIDSDKPTPLFIWIHGGGFRGGDKRGVNAYMLRRFADHGVSFASMNYRLSDVGPYPMQMLDSARGIQTIRHRAKRYNIDPKRIACGGSSAGAGISMWLLYHDDLADKSSADPVARQSTRISCAVSIAGQTSYDPRVIQKLFNTNQVHEALVTLYRMRDAKDLNRPEPPGADKALRGRFGHKPRNSG
jgi:acetyl esterase/lipase